MEAAVALPAALLTYKGRVAALRAHVADGRGRHRVHAAVAALDEPELLGLLGREELGEGPGDGVGDRADPVGAEADVSGAADTGHLLDDLRQPSPSIRQAVVAEEVGHEPAEGRGEGLDV